MKPWACIHSTSVGEVERAKASDKIAMSANGTFRTSHVH
jgi:hypothetical protein